MKPTFLPDSAHPGRILAVDDDPVDLRMLAAQLEGQPFRLTLARSAEEALGLCRTTLFEAILSDVCMPGLDGPAFCLRLKETVNAHTPLVILSGHPAGEEWIARGLEAGAIDFLPKPCPVPELIAKLRVLVRLSRQQAALSESQRQEALLEVAGGAAHELSQPLAAARLLLDRLERQREQPTPAQMAQLRDFVDQTASILEQIRSLRIYVTKPYPAGSSILDLEKSREASGAHLAYRPAKPSGKE
ncbi:MAG TPA: response regulator [Holophagaceae bacterium]|nr:response regulator [Holophagaceae bacterium]